MYQIKQKYNSFYSKNIKRMLDVLLAILLICLLIPVFLILSILIVMKMGFPIIYKGQRGGYRGREFTIYKFRTMVKNAEQIGGGTSALNDSRITPIGSILRKTKLDEIPQLFNILKGDMSFIGPRPELLGYTKEYKGDEKKILMVRPGITDFSSIYFINLDEVVGEINPDDQYEKVVLPYKNQLRIRYVDSISFLTDCKIFFITIKKVLYKVFH